MTRRFVPFLLVLTLLGALSGCHSNVQANNSGTTSKKAAPNFELKDADGKSVSLSDYKGKVVLLNFWATWCGPCKMEIPWFIEFEQKYKSQGLEVVGVSMDDEGWSAVKPFLAEQKVNYRVLLGNDVVGEQYGGIESLPTTFILDQDGNIQATHVGLVSKSEYEDDLKKLLHSQKTSRADQPAAPAAGVVLPVAGAR